MLLAAPAGALRNTAAPRRWDPGPVHGPDADGPMTRRGVVRLLNTTAGRALCLAGEVDETAVTSFWRRYGREPAAVDVIDTRSATWLSSVALELVHDHLSAAERAGRRVNRVPPAPSPAPPRR
jgi:hypothetical protein